MKITSLGISEACFLLLCSFSIFEQVDHFNDRFHEFLKKDLVCFKALQYVGDCEVVLHRITVMQKAKRNGFACPAVSLSRYVGHINAPSGGAKPLNNCLIWMKGKDNY
nr:MAG TPA: hypothetical protein [Caudoviricetes sp.]